MTFTNGNTEWKKRKHNNGGHPTRAFQERNQQILEDEFKAEDMRRSVQVAISRMNSGDGKARHDLWERVLPPVENAEHKTKLTGSIKLYVTKEGISCEMDAEAANGV